MLTGFDGFEFWQDTDPVLTTVRCSPAYDLGVHAAAELIARLHRHAQGASESGERERRSGLRR